jgi:hypothetical protein
VWQALTLDNNLPLPVGAVGDTSYFFGGELKREASNLLVPVNSEKVAVETSNGISRPAAGGPGKLD